MKKHFLLPAFLLAALSVCAGNVDVKWSPIPGDFLATGISQDNKYVCGTSTIWNLETGSVVTSYYENTRLSAVANTGLAVGSLDDYAASFDTNEVTDYIDGMDFVHFSTARSITADGSIITGSRFDEAYHQTPGYWQDGEFHTLPLPEKYEDMPDEVEVYSVAAGGISADGSVIVGNIITGTGAEALIMWTRDESGKYVFHPLYAGLMEFGMEEVKPYINISAQQVSENGEWVSLVLQLNSWEDYGYYAGRYNIKTGEVERAGKLRNYIECDYYATGISNDGTVVGFLEQAEMMMYGRRSYLWLPGTTDIEMVSHYYDTNEDLETIESSVATVFTDISGDGKHIVGFVTGEDYINSFVITLSNASGIDNIIMEKETPNQIFTLQGVPVTGQPKSGIYVIIENGSPRKVVVK